MIEPEYISAEEQRGDATATIDRELGEPDNSACDHMPSIDRHTFAENLAARPKIDTMGSLKKYIWNNNRM